MEAYDTNDVLLARKSETIKVTAGETAECSIALKLFASSILDSGYILWKYESSAYNFYREDSITETASNICYCYGEPFGAVEDLKSNWYCVGKSSNSNKTGVLYRYNADSTKTQIAEISNFGYFFTDPLYYDPTEDALWFASYNNNILSLSKNKSPSSISSVNNINEVSGIDFSGKIGFAFAVQGSSLYLAYTDLSNFYFQYGKISGDGPFVFEPIGSPKTVASLGVSGAITDIAILYDGTVYVLVSNVGNSEGDSGDSFIYNYNQSNTMYSRGALLKIQSTDSGFEVVDTLGWTGSSRQIAPVGEAEWEENNTTATLRPLTAYIPSLSENSNKFYGPRRFVAIKPKEIAIADCGANFLMPNRDKGQNGNMFAHNRVVTVSLSSFAILSATELKKINFSNLTLSGSGISGAWILAAGCDKSQNEQ